MSLVIIRFVFYITLLILNYKVTKYSCDYQIFQELFLDFLIPNSRINVHTDYRVYATELINFLSVIITTRVKNEIVKKELNKKYSYKQIFRMLSKYKKVRTDKDGLWEDVTKLKYIEELTKNLDV